jgi:hypothetical protein
MFVALDTLNRKYGKYTVYLGSSFAAVTHSRHAGSRGDVPERHTNLLKGETKRRRLGIPFMGELK